MNRITKYFALGAFALMFLALPSVASAQWGGRDRDDDYYGNGRYNRNIRGTLQSLKSKARNFENATNRAEDRRDDRDDRWGGIWGNGGRRNGDVGRIEDLADRFRKATDKLENEYGNGRNLNGSRDEARRVLDLGSQIENELRNLRGGRNLERQWSQIRRDLDVVADVYGGYYGNGRNNRSGDWRNRLPFPF